MEKATAVGVLKVQLSKIDEFKPGGKMFSLNYQIDLNYLPSRNSGKILRKKYCETPYFIAWEIGTIAILNNIFGPTHELVKRFKSIDYDESCESTDHTKELDFANAFLSGIDKAENLLEYLITELENR